MTQADKARKIKQTGYVARFECLGADCADTCCKGWGMQVDEATVARYKKDAPELMDAVTSGEAEHIMRRDEKTDYCVKFTDGLCGIHKEKGTEFLGDACHFYPRISRQFGEDTYRSAALSCPEVARLALFGDEGAMAFEEAEDTRLPYSLKEYKEDALDEAATEAVIRAFVDAVGDENITPERAVARIFNAAQSLHHIDVKDWGAAAPFMLKMADGKMQAAESHPADAFRVVNILVGLIAASKQTVRPRLDETVETLESALGMKVDRESLQIVAHDMDTFPRLLEQWHVNAGKAMEPVLRKWVQTQLLMASFPFAGFGGNALERAEVLAVRFATVKLALMAHMDDEGNAPDEETAIRVIQSLARFLDHLADPTFSLMAYEEAGWHKEGRLRGLIGDVDG
jgi:lysine-N-methylase